MNYRSLKFNLGVFILLAAGAWSSLQAQDIPITTQSKESKELFVQGRELFDNLRFDEAQQMFDKALQHDPNFALANVYRAMTATTDADFVRHLSKAVSAKSEVSDGERLVIESVKANAANKPFVAVTVLKKAVELYPQDKRLHHMLGLAYQGTDMDGKAEEEYQASIAIDPKFAPPYNNLGYLYRSSEDFAKSEEAFNNYIRLLPNEANPHDSIADLYTKMGQYDKAIEHYQKAVELNPKFFFSQQKIGDNLVFQGRYEEGRQAYKKAMEMTPTATNKILLQQGLANSYLFEDNYPNSTEASKIAIQWAEKESLPENIATLYQQKAFVDIEKGQLEEAEKDLQASDKIMEENNLTENRQQTLELLSLRNRALIAAKKGDFDKAMAKASKLQERAKISENPSDMKAYQMVAGIIAYEKGEYADAVEKLEKSDSNNPYSQFYLALSYQKAGKNNQARKLFSKVAQWNENTLEYALVRNKAQSAAKMGVAVEEQ